jgi:D-alanyl-D-alanine carboxypeptidase (penicillin-binding protein 5/6)
MTGCGSTDTVENPYPVYSSALSQYENSTGTFSYFASDLCVAEDVNVGTETTDSQVAEAAGVFNLNTQEIPYSQNIFEQLYPASTTKILTAYIIIKYCNLDDMVTVSDNAVTQTAESSVCNLKAGDVISVRDLLYGMLIVSGNDAAVALAEYYAGSIENFADVMNNEALALGASDSHFVNPNGMPDEDHYTTVYDMYLIFKEAIRYAEFVEIIQTVSHTAVYSDASGNEVNNVWNNTNRYINGTKEAPDGITVIGGKTGTTGAAGYCLVLYSRNEAGEDIVSIVFKADGVSNLYLLMNQILAGYAN